MSNDRPYAKRLVKWAIFLLLGIFLVSIILLGIGWSVLCSDHPYVIERIQETASEKWNANLRLEGYELEFTKPFPLIKFQINGLSYGAENLPDAPFIKVNQASSQFNPWNLISGDFNAHPFEFDSVWIHMYTDSLQNSNVGFNKNKKHKEKRDAIALEIDELPFIKFNYLDINRQNDYLEVQQWVKLSQTNITPERQASGEWSVNLHADSYFETLQFKAKNGSYLKNTQGKLNLNVALADRGKSILLDNSSLIVGKDEYLLSGQFVFDDINAFKLQIKHEGVLITDALPLLSDNLKYTLRDINIDQPIAASFTLTKDLVPDRLGTVRVDFATDRANIKYIETEVTNALLVGYYTNDVDNTGVGDPNNSAVVVDTLVGDILEVLPIRLKGAISKLKDNPQVDVHAKMDISMPRLNPLLTANDKITFSDGNAHVDFNYQGNLQKVLASPFGEQDIKLSGDAIFKNVTVETDSKLAPSPSLTGALFFDENETRLTDLLLDWLGSKVSLSGRVANLPEFLFHDDQALISDISLHFDQMDINQFMNASKHKVPSQKSKPIDVVSVEHLARKWASNLNGEIDLKIDKLIYDTLFLTDVHTHLSLYTPRLAEYIDSSMIKIEALTANFMGEDPLEIDLHISRDSITNIFVELDMPEAAKTVNIFMTEDTEITNGELGIHLNTKASLSTLLNSKNLIKDIQLDGMLKFHQLEVKLPKVDLPVRKISGDLIFDKEHLHLREVDFQYQDSPFELDGTIENYATYDDNVELKPKVNLDLKGDFINLRNSAFKTADTKPKEKDNFNPAEMFSALDTIFYHTTGKVNLYLDSVLTNEHKFQPFLLDVQLLQDTESADHHQVVVDSFYIGLGEKNYVKGNLSIKNPNAPYLDADIAAHMKFDRVGDFLVSNYIEFKDGFFDLDLKYQTPLYDTLNSENYLLKAEIDGAAKIVDGKIFYDFRGFHFDDINGNFKFDQEGLYIPNLDLKVNENQIYAKGECVDFFPFFILPDQNVSLLLDLRSPYFDFGKFTAPEGLEIDTVFTDIKTVDASEQDSLSTLSDTETKISQTHGLIDELLDKGSLDMNTTVDKVVHNNFFAEAIKGNITIRSDTVQLRNLSMDVAEGSLNIDGLISETALHRPKMEIDLKLAGNNISEIFRQFDDFGKETISYKYLKGIASVDLSFRAQTDANYSILKESLYGDLGFQLTGGELDNIPALTELKGFLFRKRRLDEIVIDTITVSASMRGSKTYIEKFFVHSTSFDFDVEGIYDLNFKDSTYILLSLPLSNLTRRYVDPDDLKAKMHQRKGPRILMESHYKKDRLKFAWKPFIFRRKTKYKLPEEANPIIEGDSLEIN